MKKLLTAAAVAAGAFLQAQNVEVKVSYGTSSLYGVAASITSGIVEAISSPNSTGRQAVNYNSDGVFAAEVMLGSANQKWKYGGSYMLENVVDNANILSGKFNTILAQTTYTWNNPENKFRFYSGVGVGVLFTAFEGRSSRENDALFAFNVSPIGVHYGEKFGVFLETNIGTKGLLQGGISYTF